MAKDKTQEREAAEKQLLESEELKQLTEKERLIAFALSTGNTTSRQLAATTGINRETISQIRKDKRVKKAVHLIQTVNGMTDILDQFESTLPRAFEVMCEIMEDKANSPTSRLDAAKTIIERIYGKPKERIEHEGNLINDLFKRLDARDPSHLSEEEALAEELTNTVH